MKDKKDKNDDKKTRGTRHGVYAPDMMNVNIRLHANQKRKLDKLACLRGETVVGMFRLWVEAATKDITLDSNDYAIIQRWVSEHEKKQKGE